MIIKGDVKCKMRGAKCEVRNAKCEMRSAKCEMRVAITIADVDAMPSCIRPTFFISSFFPSPTSVSSRDLVARTKDVSRGNSNEMRKMTSIHGIRTMQFSQ